MRPRAITLSLCASAIGLAATASAARAWDALCGTDVAADLTLERDVDCSAYTGTYALRVTADGVTIDGAGFRLIAPDVARAIEITSRSGVTIRDLDVSGFCAGTGVFLDQTIGTRLEGVTASARVDGVRATLTKGLVIDGLVADGNSGVGLYIDRIGAGGALPALAGLVLTNNGTGLRMAGLAGPWLLDDDAVFDLGGSLTSIHLENNVTDVTIRDLALPGATAGLDARNPTNARLQLIALDASGPGASPGSGGLGLALQGRGHLVEDVIANERYYGVHANDTPDLTVRRLAVTVATQAGLSVRNLEVGPSATLTLEDLRLTRANYGLELFNLRGQPGAPIVIDADVLADLSGSLTGIYFEGSNRDITVRGTPTTPLAFDNPRVGIDAATASNTRLTFEHLDVGGDGGGYGTGGTGLIAGGATPTVRDVIVARRMIGVRIAGGHSNTTIEDVTATDCASGVVIQSTTLSPTNTLTWSGLSCAGCGTALTLSSVIAEPPTIVDGVADPTTYTTAIGPTVLSVTASATAIRIDGSSANIKVHDLTLPTTVYGIVADSTSTSRLAFERVNVSGAGLGQGIRLHGQDHLLIDVTADDREYGFWLTSAPRLAITRARAARARYANLYLANLTAAPVRFDDIDLTDGGAGLQMNNVTGPWLIAAPALDVSGNDTGVQLDGNCSQITFRQLVIDNVSYGIHAAVASNSALRFEGVSVTGHGAGYGLYLAGADHVVEDLVASERYIGLYAVNANRLLVDGLVARRSTYGVYLVGFPDTLTGPDLRDLDLRDNGVALGLNGMRAPTTIGPATPTPGYLDVAGSDIGLSVDGASNVTFRNLTLPGKQYGVNGGATSNQDLTFVDIDVSGAGLGQGIRADGTDITLERVTANDRDIGVYVHSSRGLVARDIVANRCTYGAIVGGANGASAPPPVLERLDLRDNATALDIRWNQPWILDGDDADIDVTGAMTGFMLEYTSDLTLRDFILPARDSGLVATTSNTRLTLERIDGSGAGLGTGIRVDGPGHTLRDLVADDRTIGVYLSATTDPALDGVVVHRAAQYGLLLSATTVTQPLAIGRLDLDDNTVGLEVSTMNVTGAGSAAIGPATFTSVTGNPIALRVTSAPALAVDGAGLAGIGLTNPSAGVWANALGPPNPACGMTITTSTVLSTALGTNVLDCSGATGSALVIGDDGVTLEAGPGGFTIIAPDAASAISATNRSDLVIDGIVVSGRRSTGIGVAISGGTNIEVRNVVASRRDIGVDVANASDVTLTNVTAAGCLTAGAYLRTITLPLVMTGLALTDGQAGLRLGSLSGHGGGLGGADGEDLVIDDLALVDVGGNVNSVYLDANVSHVTFADLTLDGRNAGLWSPGTVTDIGLVGVDLSGSTRAGHGASFTAGSRLTLDDVVAHQRNHGVVITSADDVTITSLEVSGAVASALYLQGITLPLALDDLTLTDSTIGLDLRNFAGDSAGADFTLDASALLDLSGNRKAVNLVAVDDVAFVGPGLAIPGVELGIDASNAQNDRLVIRDVDLSSPANGGVGFSLGGADHVVEDVDVHFRYRGVAATGSGFTLREVRARGATEIGVYVYQFTTPIVLEDLALPFNGVSLRVDSPSGPLTIDSGTLASVAGSHTGITLVGVSGATIEDLALPARTYGINAGSTSNNNLTLRNLDLGTAGANGTGINLGGPDHNVIDCDVSHRYRGMLASAAPGLTVDGLVARGVTEAGLYLESTATSPSQPLTLTDLELAGCGTSLRLGSIDASAEPVTIDASVLTDLAGSHTNIWLSGATRNVTIRELTLPGTTYGVQGNTTALQDITLEDLDARTPWGDGTGVNIAGTNVSVTDLTVDRRYIGVHVASDAPGFTLAGYTSHGVDFGLYWFSPTPPAALSDLTITNAYRAIQLTGVIGPFTLDGDDDLVTLARNDTDLYITSSTALTLRDLDLAGVSAGLSVPASNSAFDLVDLDTSGVVSGGYGVDLDGPGHEVVGLRSDHRDYALNARGSATGLVVDGLTANATGTALYIIAVTPTLAGLSLTNAYRGIRLDSVTTPFTIGPSTALDLTGTWTGIYAVGQSVDLTLEGLGLHTLSEGFIMQNVPSSRRLTVRDVDASPHRPDQPLQCRSGYGLRTYGSDNGFDRVTVAGRGVGIEIGDGDHAAIGDSVIGANGQGVVVTGASQIVQTTVVADAASSPTTFRVASATGLAVGAIVRVRLPGGDEDRTIATLAGTLVTLGSALSTTPPVGTVVGGEGLGDARVTITTSDICANFEGVRALSAAPVSAETNYWRATSGPRHATNPGAAGDPITGTAIDFTPFEPVPFDKANPYCNQSPIADAGPDQIVCQGDLTTLDGSASSDPDVEPLTHTWTQLAGPGVTLAPSGALATFIPPPAAAGATLVFELGAADDRVTAYDTMEVGVLVRNLSPTAVAGADQAIDEGAAVSLDGSASSDPEATGLVYAWIQTAGPAVTLVGAGTATPTFTAPLLDVGGAPSQVTLTFELTVTDQEVAGLCGGVATGVDTIDVAVSNVNHDPIADAGPDADATEETVVTLDGSASSDPDDDTLLYQWTQIDGPAVTLIDGATATPSFLAPAVVGSVTLTFRLAVTDGFGAPVTDTVTITLHERDDCPDNPDKTEPGLCGCDVPDTDTDGDLTPDCLDGCATDPAKVAPGQCGCGASDADADGDLTADCVDGCPADPAKLAPGVCGCGTPDADVDLDGIADCEDQCVSGAAGSCAPTFFLSVRGPSGPGQIACTYTGGALSCAQSGGVAVVTPVTETTSCE